MNNFRDFFILGLLVSLFPTLAPAEVIERLEAIVNKKAIYKSDVNQFNKLISLRVKIDPLFANDPLSRKQNSSESEVVNYLVDEFIISEKFTPNDAEVEQEINSIQGNLKIDRDALKAAIAREGFKFEDYFKLMRVSLAKRQLIDREIRNKSVVTDDDVKAEYNRAHSGSKSFRGSFRISLLEFKKNDFKSAVLAKDQAAQTLGSLKKGTEFSGEDLGYLSYSEMSPALQKEVQKLGPDKLSDLIEEPSRYLIVKIGDIKADGDENYEREKDILRGRLMDTEFQHQIKLWIDRARAQNFVRINIKSI